MTFNLPPSSLFSVNSSENSLNSSLRCSCGEKNIQGFPKPRRFSWEVEDPYDLGTYGNAMGCSCESIPNDVLDLLPSDPFGMDLDATFTTIAGWIEGFEVGTAGYESDAVGSVKDDYRFVADFNFVWDTALMVGPETDYRLDGRVEEKEFGDGSFDGGFVSVCDIEEILSCGDEENMAMSCQTNTTEEHTENCSRRGEAPHDALEYVINYLDLSDLLSIERVCTTMYYWVHRDNSLWKSIHVDQPLNERLTDEALIRLTERAHGNLECLSLVECPRITDDGLKHVLQYNPRLTKLSVPGCQRISIEGLVKNLKIFNSQGTPGIKCLRIGELYGVTHKHFEELKLLLSGANKDDQQPKSPRKPRLYPFRHSSLCIDRGFGILDIEICSRCATPKILYDCPTVGCQGKPRTSQGCRACSFCIKRCCWCGVCITNDSEYEETFSLEWICSSCWKEKAFVAGPRHTIFHQETYHFRLFG